MKSCLTSKSVFTGFVIMTVPFMMCGNMVVSSVGGLHLYLSLLVNCVFFFFYFFLFLSKNRHLNLWLHKSSLYLLLLLVYFISLNVLHGNITSFSYVVIYSFFILLTILFFYTISSYDVVFLSIVIGTILTIIRVVYEVGADLFNISVSTRYDLDFIGGINNFAYIVTLSVIISYYKISHNVVKALVLSFLVLFNLLTLSRGANLILFLFFFTLLLKKENVKYLVRFGWLFIMLVIYLVYDFFSENDIDFDFLLRYDIFSDMEGSSSNRTIVWSYALSKINTMQGLLWGFGSATYNQVVGNHVLTSLHNQYLDFLYSFGCVLSLPFFYTFIKYYLRCVKLFYTNPFVFWINTVYVISFCFDTRIWVIQTVWIYPLVISFSLRNLINWDLHKVNVRIKSEHCVSVEK